MNGFAEGNNKNEDKRPDGKDQDAGAGNGGDMDFSALHEEGNMPLSGGNETGSAGTDDKIRLSSLYGGEGPDPARTKQAGDLYTGGMTLADSVIKNGPKVRDIEAITAVVEKLTDFIRSGTQELLDYVFSKDEYNVHYVSLNMLNVCILSLEVGIAMDMDNNDLRKLGVASFLHDIGMVGYLDIISKAKKLTKEEYKELGNHPEEGIQSLKEAGIDIEDDILESIGQGHKCVENKMFSEGIKSDKINKFTQIIGFVDVYTALTHSRPYRPSCNPVAAMKIVLGSKESFNPRVLKIFLEKVGLYPKGALAELNTKEVVKVIRHNPEFPLAPTVKVVFDSQNKRVDIPRIVDLSTNPSMYIVKCR